MKIQCSCGAKFAFDVTPDMAGRSVQFICPTCGLDASAFVNQLVRQELAGAFSMSAAAPSQAIPIPAPTQAASPPPGAVRINVPPPAAAPGAPPTPRPVSVPTPAPVRVAPAAASIPPAAPAPAARVRVQLAETLPSQFTAAPADEAARCSKHPHQLATEKCYVCSRPICPKCMELFGYVCSPLCKAKAEAQGIQIPVFAGQKSVVESKLWRKVGVITYSVCGVLALWLGLWFWYAWFGSMPSPSFVLRFEEVAFSGQSAFCGKDQIVFMHGGEFARHDMKQKKRIWSRNLVDMKKIEADAATAIKKMEEARANSELSASEFGRIPSLYTMTKRLQRAAEADLQLKVIGDNIWVLNSDKLTRYDRDTGNPVKEIELPKNYGRLIAQGDELLNWESDALKDTVTHINLNTCETRTEEIRRSSSRATNDTATLLAAATRPGAGKAAKRDLDFAGLPTTPGKDAGKPMDPKKVAEQASHMSLPERLALPVTIANSRNQERALAEAKDPSDSNDSFQRKLHPEEDFRLILTKNGYVQVAIKMLEEHFTERVAMKSAPTKSVLDGNLTVTKTAELANEMLNDMQRERGGATEREDESRYQVTFKRPDDPNPWTGEVIGPPQLFPLNTVDVLSGNKLIMVFDKTHKKLWQATLNYNIQRGFNGLDEETERYGQGPCVERKDALYVFDRGVLTAFDLATGNVRWRLPSVGISGLFFDDQEKIYLNTTTASPDTIKYSRQIDITQKNAPVVMKVDAKTGKALWATEAGGPITYVSGKFVYTLQSYAPLEDDEHPFEQKTGFETPPYVHIKRLNPKSGRQMWDFFEQRAPWDVQFDKNTIRLVFKREVTVLKYFTL
jgi:hypothetical protein